jgi:hypothetical protein
MISTWVLVCAVSAAAAPAPELKITGDVVHQQTMTLRLEQAALPAAGVAITASYRQNAHKKLQHVQQIGTTAADGTLRWEPAEPGVVVLAWEGGSRNVSVLHHGVPVAGVLVALIAGLLLLGGSVFFVLQMLRRQEH